MMLKQKLVGAAVAATLLVSGLTAYAQVRRTYRPGTVWNMNFIRMKPGMDSAYLNYIATTWKAEQEAMKKEGLLVSYKVLTTEGHNTQDFNIILMTEFKDMGTMEANEVKADALSQKISGDDQKQMQGYMTAARSARFSATVWRGRSFSSRAPRRTLRRLKAPRPSRSDAGPFDQAVTMAGAGAGRRNAIAPAIDPVKAPVSTVNAIHVVSCGIAPIMNHFANTPISGNPGGTTS